MGKQKFSSSTESLFLITQCNCTSIGSYSTKKQTNGSAAVREPMAMQPAKMGGASGYTSARFAAASQISSKELTEECSS